MSRIEWNKDKNRQSNTNTTKSKKGQKALTADCSSASSFFNFLTQK